MDFSNTSNERGVRSHSVVLQRIIGANKSKRRTEFASILLLGSRRGDSKIANAIIVPARAKNTGSSSPRNKNSSRSLLFCREEVTRTPDPHVPNVVRYQLRYFSSSQLACDEVCLSTKRSPRLLLFGPQTLRWFTSRGAMRSVCCPKAVF